MQLEQKNFKEELIMKNVLKKVGVVVSALLLSCGIIVGVSSAATSTGKYSKLVGINDKSNSKAITTMTNTSTSSRYSQVFVYKDNDTLVKLKEQAVSAGSTLSVTTSNSYPVIRAHSCIYKSSASQSGSAEGLDVTIK